MNGTLKLLLILFQFWFVRLLANSFSNFVITHWLCKPICLITNLFKKLHCTKKAKQNGPFLSKKDLKKIIQLLANLNVVASRNVSFNCLIYKVHQNRREVIDFKISNLKISFDLQRVPLFFTLDWYFLTFKNLKY